MAINKNHEFEDLEGIKCAVVEKNATKERTAFLKQLLEFNQYEVMVVPTPPPKVAPAKKVVTTAEETSAIEPTIQNETPPLQPETFTIGVTNVMFNPINSIFGRLLHTPDGNIVTLAYWEQKESVSQDELPYYITNRELPT